MQDMYIYWLPRSNFQTRER